MWRGGDSSDDVTICQHVSSLVWYDTRGEDQPGIVSVVPAACCTSLSSSVCHVSCASCSGPAASHCIACIHPQALHQGHCLPSCGQGFYPNHGVCEGMVGFAVVPHAQSQGHKLTPPPTQILLFSTTFFLCVLNVYKHIRACAISLCWLLVP